MEKEDKEFFEALRRLHWYIYGIGIHCLTPRLFNLMSTERICELYNVEMSYFRK